MPDPTTMTLELATIGSECTEIPTNWLERCFLAHRKESAYIPKVCDLLRIWHGSLRVDEFNERALQAPKSGPGHDCRYCLVVSERLTRFNNHPGNDRILSDIERTDLANAPTIGEVKCWVNCLAGLTKDQFGIILEHYGDRKNPYGLTTMEMVNGRDTLKSGRKWERRTD